MILLLLWFETLEFSPAKPPKPAQAPKQQLMTRSQYNYDQRLGAVPISRDIGEGEGSDRISRNLFVKENAVSTQ